MPSAASTTTVPHVFVLSGTSAERLAVLRTLEVHCASQELKRGVAIWCLQTFLELKKRGWPVELASDPKPGCVNLVHVRELYRRRPAAGVFIVSIQADYPAVPWTSANVVQNRLQADGRRSHWIAHWPQPGLIGRSRQRDRVECVAYAGDSRNLAGSALDWAAALKSRGIEFRHLDQDNWNDYTGVDVLVALRSFDKSRYEYKPPSKLFNAWHARIPLVAGHDSAFEQVGQPGRDYLRVCTLDQAIKAICALRDDRDRYRSIVDAGAARAREYSRERIADSWEDLLSGPIASRYQWWKQNQLVSDIGQWVRFRTWPVRRLLGHISRRFS